MAKKPDKKTGYSELTAYRGAPPYNPELWNDRRFPERSKENLWALSRDPAVTKIIAYEEKAFEKYFKNGPDALTAMFSVSNGMSLFLRRAEQQQNDFKKLAEQYGMTADEMKAAHSKIAAFDKLEGFQNYTNCYAYAVNDPDRNDTSGNIFPGQRAGIEFKDSPYSKSPQEHDAYVQALKKGLIADGAKPLGTDMPPANKIPNNHYVMAFYTAYDPTGKIISDGHKSAFHFARQNNDGTWSHKFGDQPVQNTDASGAVIKDIKAADMGIYKLEGFYLVPSTGLDVGTTKHGSDPKGKQEPNYSRPWLNPK